MTVQNNNNSDNIGTFFMLFICVSISDAYKTLQQNTRNRKQRRAAAKPAACHTHPTPRKERGGQRGKEKGETEQNIQRKGWVEIKGRNCNGNRKRWKRRGERGRERVGGEGMK